MTGQRWDRDAVAARLEEAADVLARLPGHQASGVYHLWPRIVGPSGSKSATAAAAPEAIDRMDEALGWLMWLEPEERQVVYTPAGGEPVSVRVIARRPDTIVGFGDTRIHAETATFELRANEVSGPGTGDLVTIGSEGIDTLSAWPVLSGIATVAE
jgi:hypothetical protein